MSPGIGGGTCVPAEAWLVERVAFADFWVEGPGLTQRLLGSGAVAAWCVCSRTAEQGEGKYVGTEEGRKKLWEHTVQEVNVHCGK